MAGLTVAELEGVIGVDDSMFSKGLDAAMGKFESWGKGAKGIMAGIGAVGGGLFAAGVMGALNGQQMAGRLQAEMGLTEKESARLGKVAGKVYAQNYGESLDEVGGALTAVVSSIKGMRNASDAEIEAMTKRAIGMSDVFGIDVTRAAQVAGVAIQNGLARDGVEAFDLLTVAMQKVPVQLREDVLDATEEYAGFFTQLGISGPAAFAMLSKGAEKGMYGIDKTGDAIKEFTIRATDMSSTSQNAYKQIGLNATKMTNKLLKGGETGAKAFDTIVESILNLKNPAKQSAVALALFGTPLEDMGTKDIPKFLKGLDQSGSSLGEWRGAADKAGQAIRQGPGVAMGEFTRSLKSGFVKVVGGTVIPIINDLTAHIKGIAEYLREHETVARTVLIGTAGLFALWGVAATVNAAKNVVAWVTTAIAATASGNTQKKTAAQLAVRWAWLAAKSMASAVRIAAAWLISIGPIAIVIAAVVGLGVLIYKNWEKIKKWTGKAWNWITAKVTGAWGAVKGATTTAIGAVVGFVQKIPGRFTSALSSLKSAVVGVFRGAMNAALDKVKSIGGTIKGWIAGIPGKLLQLGSSFASAGRRLLQGFIDGMKNAAGIISGIAGNVWNAVKGLLNGAIDRVNAALEFTINLPGPKDLHVNIADIPHLATGGRATGATLAVFGEGREAETVLPDSMLRGLLEDVHASGRASASKGGGAMIGGDVNFNGVQGASPRALMDELGHALRVASHGGVYQGAH